MSNFEERRVYPRIEQSEAVEAKIVFTSDNPRQLGKILDGSTVDVSASGLRLSLQAPLTVNSTIDINVILRPDFMEYFLSAKVRWCKQMDDSSYHVGVALQDLLDIPTDYNAWQAALTGDKESDNHQLAR
jgi:hypothetical protein